MSLIEKEKIIAIENFSAFYGKKEVLKNLNLHFYKNSICCIVGASGGGKSTLLRSLNRINDETEGFSTAGVVRIGKTDIYTKAIDVALLRTQVGMVFQKPIVFPKTIEDNVLFGIKHNKKLKKQERPQVTKKYLEMAHLWDEVKDRLKDSPLKLSIGQQQRLCIARALAVEPEILLLDEPTSALDPIATRAIENLVLHLKQKLTIIFVTHNMEQANRISDQIVRIENGTVQV
ncbi:MAG: phosphate transport system ATP-binding protein [Crocinitomix sp.]|jgi:phosphate transport system ATP-binding protein